MVTMDQGLSEDRAVFYAAQMVLALQDMQAEHILYRFVIVCECLVS